LQKNHFIIEFHTAHNQPPSVELDTEKKSYDLVVIEKKLEFKTDFCYIKLMGAYMEETKHKKYFLI